MSWKTVAMMLAAPVLAMGSAPSAVMAAPPKAREASIPFVNMGSIRDWRPDGSKGLYVQDLRGRWYYATLMGACFDLPYVDAIGFETRGIDTLDKFGTVIVRGQRCAFSSFVTSHAPPSKMKKGHKG